MSSSTMAQEQLLELLLQLKKTTPDQARVILNSQPQIAYALMTTMVNIGAINAEVVQKTLSGALTSAGSTSAPPAASVAAVPPATAAGIPGASYAQMQPQLQTQASPTSPAAAIPPHMQGPPSQGGTPPYSQNTTPPYPRGGGTPPYPRNASAPSHPSQPSVHPGTPAAYPFQATQPVQPQPPYAAQRQVPAAPYAAPVQPNPVPPAVPPALQETLVSMSDEQKALIMRVVSMTSEEIQRLPPQERSNIIQLRQTLGVPV